MRAMGSRGGARPRPHGAFLSEPCCDPRGRCGGWQQPRGPEPFMGVGGYGSGRGCEYRAGPGRGLGPFDYEWDEYDDDEGRMIVTAARA